MHFVTWFERFGAVLCHVPSEPSAARHERCVDIIQARSCSSPAKLEIVAGHQWFISFMTRGELLMWPKVNRWSSTGREELIKHINLCTTLFLDEATCLLWADIMAASRAAGRPITASDAWIAATARQWDLALVTADYSNT